MNRDEVILAKKMATQRKVITCRVRAGSTDILFFQKFNFFFKYAKNQYIFTAFQIHSIVIVSLINRTSTFFTIFITVHL